MDDVHPKNDVREYLRTKVQLVGWFDPPIDPKVGRVKPQRSVTKYMHLLRVIYKPLTTDRLTCICKKLC